MKLRPPRGFRRWVARLVDVATLAILAGAIWLFVEARLDRANGRPGRTDFLPSLRHGAEIGEIAAVDEFGQERVLFAKGDVPRLVYVFKSDCPVCAIQKGEWIGLAVL